MVVFNEKRHDRRIPVSEQGVLTNQDDAREIIKVMITDVSYNGVAFRSEQMFSGTGRYILKYALLHRQFTWPVRIRWTLSNPDGYCTGCQKEDLTEGM